MTRQDSSFAENDGTCRVSRLHDGWRPARLSRAEAPQLPRVLAPAPGSAAVRGGRSRSVVPTLAFEFHDTYGDNVTPGQPGGETPRRDRRRPSCARVR